MINFQYVLVISWLISINFSQKTGTIKIWRKINSTSRYLSKIQWKFTGQFSTHHWSHDRAYFHRNSQGFFRKMWLPVRKFPSANYSGLRRGSNLYQVNRRPIKELIIQFYARNYNKIHILKLYTKFQHVGC